ncbi:unnamed protein product [Adineta steineri]|uniref:Uncharacterized protein n=1 Tax=Adineta steineri TaxID=433720 RepID=A0A815TKZ6_9BILA|nr:unnamed protein product [Adineta steineri]CAF1646427.1 unnamed protein product [Adineta steineri]
MQIVWIDRFGPPIPTAEKEDDLIEEDEEASIFLGNSACDDDDNKFGYNNGNEFFDYGVQHDGNYYNHNEYSDDSANGLHCNNTNEFGYDNQNQNTFSNNNNQNQNEFDFNENENTDHLHHEWNIVNEKEGLVDADSHSNDIEWVIID